MSRRTMGIIAIACLLASAGGRAGEPAKDDSLRIHLPREITIEGNIPSLGQVGIIRGGESLVARADKITLGRISAPGQEIAISRVAVLSRLASNGIPASKVTLTGAEKVKVRQQSQTIKAGEFVDLARSFLGKNPPAGSVCRFDLLRGPKDLILEGARKDMKLVPRLVKVATPSQARVQIAVIAGGKEIARGDVSFRMKYKGHKVVTLADIPAGAIISAENVKLEETVSSYPEPANWAAPYGLVARRRLPKNTVIVSNMVGPIKPPIVIKRNQSVLIKIEVGGLSVTAIGQSVEDGRAGQYIRVRNVDSQRIILAKVNEDGTVQPVY